MNDRRGIGGARRERNEEDTRNHRLASRLEGRIGSVGTNAVGYCHLCQNLSRAAFAILVDRRTARHDQLGHQNLDDFVPLVARLAADCDHAAVGTGPRCLDLVRQMSACGANSDLL